MTDKAVVFKTVAAVLQRAAVGCETHQTFSHAELARRGAVGTTGDADEIGPIESRRIDQYVAFNQEHGATFQVVIEHQDLQGLRQQLGFTDAGNGDGR